MPLDAALVTETRSRLVKAEKDLRAAQHGLGASPALLVDAAFHALAVQLNPASGRISRSGPTKGRGVI